MAIVDTAAAWSAPIALAAKEIWQACGEVFLSTEASPGTRDGLHLKNDEAVVLASGQSVRHRSGTVGAQIIRMPFA